MIDTESRTVQPGDVNPEGKSGECATCAADLGSEHGADCPHRRRTVVVDFTIRMVMEVPEGWTRTEIEDHFNEDRCASNLLGDMIDIAQDEDTPCLCGRTVAVFVAEATRSDEAVYSVVRDESYCDHEGGCDGC